jgi:hypothetical protein
VGQYLSTRGVWVRVRQLRGSGLENWVALPIGRRAVPLLLRRGAHCLLSVKRPLRGAIQQTHMHTILGATGHIDSALAQALLDCTARYSK